MTDPTSAGFVPYTGGPLSKTSILLKAAAERCGYSFCPEAEFGFVGQIRNGTKAFRWRGGLFDINSCGASALTRDKGYAFAQMSANGIRTPKTLTVFAPNFTAFARLRGTASALRFAHEIGYPVFIKPNEGSRAIGALKAENDDELCYALEKSFALKSGRVSLVQEFLSGPEWRFLVLDQQVQFGYKKRVVTCEGDGKTPLKTLLADKQARLQQDVGRAFSLTDERLWESFYRRGWNEKTCPSGTFRVGDGLSLELGAGVEVVKTPTPEAQTFAVNCLDALGLRYGSVDAIEVAPNQFVAIEANSAPGVTGLAARGNEELAISLYANVLKAFFEK